MKKFTLIVVALLLVGVGKMYAAVGDIIMGEATLFDMHTLKTTKVKMAFQVLSMPRTGKVTRPGTVATYGKRDGLTVTNCVQSSAPGYVLTVPETVEDYTVIGIGDYSFASMMFSAVILPDAVQAIGAFAFDAFEGRIGPTTGVITLPAKCKTLSNAAFRNYKTAVTSIDMPDVLTTIGTSAFKNVAVESVTLPKSVSSIGAEAFANCTTLTSLTVNEENTTYYSPEGSNVVMRTEDNALVLGCAGTTAIPDNATAIETSAFYGMPVSGLTIPATVTAIGNNAFRGTGLTTLELPATVATVGTYAFASCEALTKVDIKNSGIDIGANAFSSCANLAEVYIRGTEDMPTLAGSDNEFSGIKEGAILYVASDKLDDYKADGTSWVTQFGADNIKAYTTDPVVTYKVGDIITTTITVMSPLGKNMVEALAQMAFQIVALPNKMGKGGQCITIGQQVGKRILPCTNAKDGSDVTVPSSVKMTDFYVFEVAGIGQYSFNELNFKRLQLPNTIVGIMGKSFVGFKGQIGTVSGDLTLPDGLELLMENAFAGYASSVNNITIPTSIKEIRAGAFAGVDVKSIVVPNTVQTLTAGFANSCTSLTSLSMSDRSLKYYSSAEHNVILTTGNTVLQASANTTTLPDNTVAIGNKAFYGMPIESIDLPASVTELKPLAFANCSNLKTVTIRHEDAMVTLGGSDNEFNNIAEDATLYVPADLLSEYDADPWVGWFANIKAIPEGDVPVPITFAECEIAEPTVGEAPSESFISPTGDELLNGIFSETVPQWFPHQPTFTAGKAYTVRMHVSCTAPKYFADDFTATVNGEPANIINRKYDDDGYCHECTISYTWHVSATKTSGDTNGDSKVNTADVVAIYNYIEKGEASGFTREAANTNGDENVNTADVVYVYDRIITGTSTTFTLDGVDFKMIPVTGGTFLMGAPEEDTAANANEKPQHKVTLGDFAIGETEVTQALWKAVYDDNPSYSTIGDNMPVECVTWNDAQNFIAKLNTIFADQLDGKVFRLPTEAEWEYAARGGAKSKGYMYSGGDVLDEVAWTSSNSESQLHEVASLAPNELGLYDMSGNVWEWCHDLYANYSEEDQTNPTGPAFGDYATVRGSAFNYDMFYSRVTARQLTFPNYLFTGTGLRLVLGAPIE